MWKFLTLSLLLEESVPLFLSSSALVSATNSKFTVVLVEACGSAPHSKMTLYV